MCEGAVRVLEGHDNHISCVASLGDGGMASGSYDMTVRTWGADGQCARVLDGHDNHISCVASLEDGRVASGSS